MDYRCNDCGYNFTEPQYCPSCGTTQCPNCSRTNSITNLTEMNRMYSHRVQLAPRGRQTRRKNKPKKSVQDRIAELDAITK